MIFAVVCACLPCNTFIIERYSNVTYGNPKKEDAIFLQSNVVQNLTYSETEVYVSISHAGIYRILEVICVWEQTFNRQIHI